MLKCLVWLVLVLTFYQNCHANKADILHTQIEDDTVLIFLSMDGTLHGVRRTGKRIWTRKQDHIVKVPSDTFKGPTFIPDPKDGSLYRISNSIEEEIKKMPFTIPELVQVSPSQSKDGILYTGKKVDLWYVIDKNTGKLIQELSLYQPICPVIDKYAKPVYIGVSKYLATMYDTVSRILKWNVTFYEYVPFGNYLGNYDLNFISSTTNGLTVALDSTGNVVFERDFGSPIVAVYLPIKGVVRKLPVISVAEETVIKIMKGENKKANYRLNELRLRRTLYIGKNDDGLYAMPSFVEEGSMILRPNRLMPNPVQSYSPSASKSDSHELSPYPNYDFSNDIITNMIGYHEEPDRLPNTPTKRPHALHNEITKQNDTSGILSENFDYSRDDILALARTLDMTLKVLIAISIGIVTAVAVYFYNRNRSKNKITSVTDSVQDSSESSTSNSGLSNSILNSSSTSTDSKLFTIGKITIDLASVIGKGSFGTSVYRGRFDNRDVAVKRVLLDYQRFAEREVALLRKSDQHDHVIRYYCTENDDQFQYIALELCSTTLSECIKEDRFSEYNLQPVEALYQFLDGLSHLHSLEIIHRDVKPQNILVKMLNSSKRGKVILSDFGLCKQITLQGSYGYYASKSTGLVVGTEGWMAPELFQDDAKYAFSADIFSAGCVIYYTFSKGKHPFGQAAYRQSNIRMGYSIKFDDELEGSYTEIDLIKKMITANPKQRPTALVAMQHPVYWSNGKQLSFFLDISDRIEKEPSNSKLVELLESKSITVTRGDWKKYIGNVLEEDLRKFRSYKGDSVKDLLRALRNKKHHYYELSIPLREELGDLPDSFVQYFTSKFPRLLIHCFATMSILSNESTFKQYYGR
ncbi:uncharacterized protein TRIADDRAFT_53745 [Trichoplax adhaerens]|uniref:non-specific serine/threonine protein kinase n=1 Tax=Trichoplax adhaerens TaxID=10228 RepID=B3RQ19_TRIAD|nr:hypothetical protein TRIADDRAFT_53745 [Trichoplax adhaerens]EDV28277.1 hypothetical protein TRIADDRAFT_53745 [Trichoplax adhaerens]|eukprot:XP_002110111.1 hypothetical protein TRIADDRAFT_53745 [Trichoplax adhaerens]